MEDSYRWQLEAHLLDNVFNVPVPLAAPVLEVLLRAIVKHLIYPWRCPHAMLQQKDLTICLACPAHLLKHNQHRERHNRCICSVSQQLEPTRPLCSLLHLAQVHHGSL